MTTPSEFPGNSLGKKAPAKKAAAPPKKKVQQVTTGVVQRRKKPWRTKVKESFMGDDTQSVGSYMFFDVMIPYFKDMIFDAATGGLERRIYGEVRSIPRGRGAWRPGSGHPTNPHYRPYASAANAGPPAMSRRARSQHDFGEIVLDSRVEADAVIASLYELVATYDMASVADLYELCGYTSDYPDGQWGWTNMEGAHAERARGGGYVLRLPRTEHLKD